MSEKDIFKRNIEEHESFYPQETENRQQKAQERKRELEREQEERKK